MLKRLHSNCNNICLWVEQDNTFWKIQNISNYFLFKIFSLFQNNLLWSAGIHIFRSICNIVFARPKYENNYPGLRRSPSAVPLRMREEIIYLFLTHSVLESSKEVIVLGYSCEGNAISYRLMPGLKENSLFVLQISPNSSQYFIIHEFIDNLSHEFIYETNEY